MNNFMIQDIVGISLAFALFPLLLIAPGYVAARSFDLLDFRDRKFISRIGIALLLSSSISPIIFFLTDRLGSRQFTLLIAFIFFAAFVYLFFRDLKVPTFSREDPVMLKKISIICAAWIIFAILFLMDIQWGNRLYYNVAGFDYSTRAAVINAITRTGVPPINPGYFPEQQQLLTFLYYFWYVLCSIIDQLGGGLVDARMALMASVIWTGLGLMSSVGIYIQARNPQADSQLAWQKVKIGLKLLLVSGLDIFPSTFFILFPQFLPGRMIDGDIEQWNEQITAWIGSVTWTPHHVISLLACLTAWILIGSSQNKSLPRQAGSILISGLALASAFGLSVWITLVFAIFWMVWFAIRLVSRESVNRLWTMIAPGFVAGIAIIPFLIDLLGGSTSGSTGNQIPLAFRVREFFPLEIITLNSRSWEGAFLNFAALPINYFLELGFFSVVGILWFQYGRKRQQGRNEFLVSEISLFLTTLFLVTFVRSAVITHNDFGWRGSMFAQFILLIWGVDLIEYFWGGDAPLHILLFRRLRGIKNIRKVLTTMMVIGVITSMFDVAMLRFWPMVLDTGIVSFPRILSRDIHLGERTFAARETFTYIENNLPVDIHVQFSPGHLVDTLSGLYRTRSAIVSYNTLYGVSPKQYEPLIDEIQNVFDDSMNDWQQLDLTCRRYDIDYIILRDIDALWKRINALKSTRPALYNNPYFAIFPCGN